MARSAVLSNGRLCVGLDESGFVNDFYYPYVGLENTTSARSIHHKIGLWVDGSFSWLDSMDWTSESHLDENSLMGRTLFMSERLGVSVSFRDFVDKEHDFFGRLAIVQNHRDTAREVRMFFGQVFQISPAGRADTGIYTAAKIPYILTYNSNISFVIGLRTMDGDSFDQFAVGNYGIEGKAGTYMDAEDGELSGNLVEHGGVDSVIRSSFTIPPKGSYHLDYWVCASDKTYSHATRLHRTLGINGLYMYLNSTILHWKSWLMRSSGFINDIEVKYQALAKRSLLTIAAHMDSRGGVIASADSSIYNYGRDYYNYVWPRDAYYSLSPLLKLGYVDEVKRYLEFAIPLIHPRGYVQHKYLPDSTPGSTWHPLVQYGKPELNIQEDETASLVLLALDFIEQTEDTKYHERLTNKIVIPCSEFMASYMDDSTGLPHASYDLWEQVFLTNTYTVSVTYAALIRATALLNGIGKKTDHWKSVTDSIKKNIGKLFSEERQWFVRGLKPVDAKSEQLLMLDIASLYGLSRFGPSKFDDTAVYATQVAIEANNVINGGVVRYRGDDYMRPSDTSESNPWYVATLWLGQHYLRCGDTDGAIRALDWTLSHATKSGMLSEQLDPQTGEVRGVAPLIWSHAEFLSLLLALSEPT